MNKRSSSLAAYWSFISISIDEALCPGLSTSSQICHLQLPSSQMFWPFSSKASSLAWVCCTFSAALAIALLEPMLAHSFVSSPFQWEICSTPIWMAPGLPGARQPYQYCLSWSWIHRRHHSMQDCVVTAYPYRRSSSSFVASSKASTSPQSSRGASADATSSMY